MKRLISPALIGLLFVVSNLNASEASMQKEIEQLKAQMQELKKAQTKMNISALRNELSEVKAHDGHDNIKWGVDFRTDYDFINYKRANGENQSNGIFTNRLWLKMAFAPNDNLAFFGTLAYYKTYGQSLGAKSPGFNYFDWVVNETANPSDELRVKEAYWLYRNNTFLGSQIPWTASIGRRPATDGLLVNYREDQKAKSPLGHLINMEFDGASFAWQLENVTNVPGMYFKVCMGRGMSNVEPRFYGITQNTTGTGGNYFVDPNATAYTKVSGRSTSDLAGFIFKPYDDGQYSVHTMWLKAFNLPGMIKAGTSGGKQTYDFDQTGNMTGGALSVITDGVGNGNSDFLFNTILFASVAYTKTHPKDGYNMLGSPNSQTGTSIYVGANFPAEIINNATVGLEYNHGSKYWRSFTYSEDTLIGSKLAARGDAYEFWLNKDLMGKKFTAQLRYTYINYNYTGSNAFFGDGGKPMTMNEAKAAGINPVSKAQDIRLYLRYRY